MAAERVWLVSHIAYCRMPFTIRCFYLSVLFEEPSCSDQLVTFGITRSLIKLNIIAVYSLFAGARSRYHQSDDYKRQRSFSGTSGI